MNELSHEVKSVSLAIMEGLACPRSLTVSIMVRYGLYEDLAELSADPLHYLDSESYWAAAQATGFLKKFPHLPTGLNLEDRARKAFWASEHTCYKTNERLSPFLFGAHAPEDEHVWEFIQRVRNEVLLILGRHPPSNWEDEARFGPGATMSDTSRYTTVPDKMSSVPSLTSNAWPFLFPWMGTQWYKAVNALGLGVNKVRGNAFFTVLKSAVSLRGCGKEPSLNVFYQLGFGRTVRKQLAKWGINLTTGQDLHREAARRASRTGDFATIDLSAASDTVAYNLVKLLLPPLWFQVFDHLRSPYTELDGKWVRLEKFSSMGNGFTFELETLIFAAIAKCACSSSPQVGKDLLVYGDDIIVPTIDAQNVISALSYFGFSTNKGKSFVSGSFRESCGGDFFDGVGVRPYYLKEDLNEPHNIIALANGLRRSALDASEDGGRWLKLRTAWFRALDLLPEPVRRCRGPKGLGDVVIHDSEQHWMIRWKNSIRYVKSWSPKEYRKVRWNGFAYDVQFAAALYGVSRRKFDHTSEGDLVPRDGVAGYGHSWVPYS